MILLVVIAGGLALLIFYMTRKSTNTIREDRSERLQRHREYYDALMERRQNPDKKETNNEDRL